MRAALLALAIAQSGCGYAVAQTAHTEPSGSFAAAFGMNYVTNELSNVAGRDTTTRLGLQISPRLGLSDHVDVGLQPWWLLGTSADVKVDVLARHNRLAIAPRAGVGYAVASGKTVMAFAGGLSSYRLTPDFEPYAGAVYANHWITRDPPDEIQLQPGESFAARTGVGDGLVELSVGFMLGGSDGSGPYLEYDLWLPAQDDPGDNYAFVTTHVFAAGLHFGKPQR